MIIVVDLDGLSSEATAEIIQGSRSGLYKGTVYDQIHRRLVATLSKDPELLDLEQEAEEELAQLQTGAASSKPASSMLFKYAPSCQSGRANATS
jgi:hypothetical protein